MPRPSRYCVNQSQVAASTGAMVASVPVTRTGDSTPRMPVTSTQGCLACQPSHDCINQSQVVPAWELSWLGCRLPARETGRNFFTSSNSTKSLVGGSVFIQHHYTRIKYVALDRGRLLISEADWMSESRSQMCEWCTQCGGPKLVKHVCVACQHL